MILFMENAASGLILILILSLKPFGILRLLCVININVIIQPLHADFIPSHNSISKSSI